jgi:heme A synthase
MNEEVEMKWNRWIRQTHRWLSVAFTVALIVNFVAIVRSGYSRALGLSAVAVLALMFLTGAYLFVLPYVAKSRGGQRTV